MTWRGYRITRVVTPAASMALVTVDQAKEALKIAAGDTSQDALLSQQIEAVSSAINNWCDRVFVVQDYQDNLRNVATGWGEPLVTRQYPIVGGEDGVPLVAVTENGSVLDPTVYEVYPETGSLYRLDNTASGAGCWVGPTILIDYTAGFGIIPPDVQGAALEWLSVRWWVVGRDPTLRAETIPDLITQTYSDLSSAATSIPAGVRDWLSAYRIWSV